MKTIELSDVLKKDVVEGIKQFFLQQRDEELSDFQATTVLEFILADIGPYIYNQALEDAHTLMGHQIEELYGLQKYPRAAAGRSK
jgi:uncharacterized protein (DUF2164 family)